MNCELSVKDYMVFIGPQASGKSTISKGIYFFKSLRDDLIKYVLDSVEKGTLTKPLGTYAKRIRSKFLNYWGSSYHLNDICLKYFYSDEIFIEISLEPVHGYIEPVFSDGFKKRFSDIVNITNGFLAEKRKREAVFLGVSEILKGEYKYDRDGEKIYISKDKYTKLNYSSSGQQEVIWILHLIFLLILEKKGVFIVIEEPEAHLFPEAQKEMVDLISLMANVNNNQVIITTHSPYIISSINNLLYAEKIGMQKGEIVSKKIYSGFWINSENLGAYYINDGTYESIIDDELDLLKVELIDSASKTINEEYDFLLDLED